MISHVQINCADASGGPLGFKNVFASTDLCGGHEARVGFGPDDDVDPFIG